MDYKICADGRDFRKKIKALKEALGYVGMIRFIQQYDRGHGDYTKEKQQDGADITYDDR